MQIYGILTRTNEGLVIYSPLHEYKETLTEDTLSRAGSMYVGFGNRLYYCRRALEVEGDILTSDYLSLPLGEDQAIVQYFGKYRLIPSPQARTPIPLLLEVEEGGEEVELLLYRGKGAEPQPLGVFTVPQEEGNLVHLTIEELLVNLTLVWQWKDGAAAVMANPGHTYVFTHFLPTRQRLALAVNFKGGYEVLPLDTAEARYL